jgi:hypothetical protein
MTQSELPLSPSSTELKLGFPSPPSVDDNDHGGPEDADIKDGGALQEEAPKKEGFMEAATSKALRPFVIISSSYLLFTITDGAIRMIVLLHAYNKSFSALEVAIMFSLYELAGVFTNLVSPSRGLRDREQTHTLSTLHRKVQFDYFSCADPFPCLSICRLLASWEPNGASKSP